MTTFFKGAAAGWIGIFILLIPVADKALASARCGTAVANAPYGKDTGSTLELIGVIRDEMGAMGRMDIIVYEDSSIFLAVSTTRSGKCRFELPLNNEYIIVFSSPGYFSKKIRINANVPAHRTGSYKFHFSLDLFEEIPGLDVSVLEEPVAIVTFNNFMDHFDYDYNYTAAINEGIKKLYSDYYSQKGKIVKGK